VFVCKNAFLQRTVTIALHFLLNILLAQKSIFAPAKCSAKNTKNTTFCEAFVFTK